MAHFIERFMKKPSLIITLIILIVFWGIYAAMQMNKDYLPQINNPTVMISIYAPHDHAEQIQKTITPEITSSLKKVNKLQSIETHAYEDGLLVSLTFPLNTNINQVQKEIHNDLRDIKLPKGVANPVVTKISSNAFPIMKISLSSDSVGSKVLRTDAKEKIKKKLEALPGVKDIKVTGGADHGFIISLRPKKLKQYHLSVDDVKASLQSLDVSWPDGHLFVHQHTLPVRVTSDQANLRQIENIKVGKNHAIPLKNVARVEKGMVNVQTLARTNGKPSVFLGVIKTQSADITKVSNRVANTLHLIPEIQSKSIKAIILQNKGKMINQSIVGLLREGLLGTIFSILSVLFFFRNIRSTLLVSLSIPISLFITISILEQLHLSFNLLTVSGMIVAMGRVVDDSIVVMDNIYRRLELSHEEVTAKLIAQAVAEMVPAILSSTLTTISVYLPIALIGGMIGAAFSGFSLSVTIALVTSLAVSIIVIPTLYWLLSRNHKPEKYLVIEPVAAKLLHFTLNKRRWIVSLALVIVVISVVGAMFIPIQVLPRNHANDINIQIECPENSTLEQVNSEVKNVESFLRTNKNIKAYSSVAGSTFTPQFDDIFDQGGGWIQRKNVANIFVKPKPNVSNEAVVADIRNGIKDLSPSVTYTVSNQQISGDDSRVSIVLSGGDQKELAKETGILQSKLQMIRGLSIYGDEGASDQLNFTVTLNPSKLQQFGIDPKQVINKVKPYYSFDNLLHLNINDHPTEIELIKKSEITHSSGGSQDPIKQALIKIGNYELTSNKGKVVHLNQIATLKATPIAAISEKDGEPISVISGNIVTKDISGVTQQINKVLKETHYPAGVSYSLNGITKQVQDMVIEMVLAILLSIFLVVMIIKTVFKGWRAPTAVLSALPFTFTGSIVGIFLVGSTWDLGALVGLVMLTGIIATNGIVLVDKIERNLSAGLPLNEAIFKGTLYRVRPVLMTAGTTVLALLPLIFSNQDHSLISKSLGIVVVGGMISGTVSSLILIPILYHFMYHFKRTFRAYRSKARRSVY